MMTGTHDPGFVILSLIIATLASYAALDLAGRVRSAEGATRYGWLAGGASVMGLGIWSMHFVAMLAFSLPVPIAYDLPQMLLSVAVAIGASLLALIVVSRASLRLDALVAGGALMGVAIAGMHYIGMASMRVGAQRAYTPSIVALSIAIAIVASVAALWLAFSFRSDTTARGHLLKSLSAAVMGVAIAGMHYTAMAGVGFVPQTIVVHPHGYVLATNTLGAAVVVGTLIILGLALVGAVIDRTLQSKVELTRKLREINAELYRSFQDAERARADLSYEHEAYAELQWAAQQQDAKARWLEGVAETATALAHEVNNPLTALMMNLEMLEEAEPEEIAESLAEIRRAAQRIAAVVKRLSSVDRPRSIAYLGDQKMLDLSSEEPLD
jgi:NO-binding membrane sensor protein with MHYT domain